MKRNRDTRPPLPVIFRAERRGGDITAVFPTICADYNGREMQCYAHVGQHGGCDLGWYNSTRAAKPDEYAPLLAELESIYGHKLAADDVAYRLQVFQRMQPAHRAEFAADHRRAIDSLYADPSGGPWSPAAWPAELRA